MAWQKISDRADELNLQPSQRRQAVNRSKAADNATNQRIGATYHWVLVPDQPDPTRPVVWRAVKVEGQTAELIDRVSGRLINDGLLAVAHSSRNITVHLGGPLTSLWQRGHISVGELWALYTRYPYLPRLRDRSVLDSGVEEALTSFTWQQDGFALAAGFDEATGRYQGLALPHADAFGQITDGTLLVAPARALQQREDDKLAAAGREVLGGPDTVKSVDPGALAVTPLPSDDANTPVPPKPKTRFFGVMQVDPEKYAKGLMQLAQDILPHLAGADGSLEVTVEITATRPSGFDQNKIRIVTENASVMKINPATFEES